MSKLDGNLQNLLASTFLGEGNGERAGFITVAGDGAIYVTGFTGSLNFPTSSTAYDRIFNGDDDGFVSKFDGNLQNLLASTFIGGGDEERTANISENSSGDIYISGATFSTDFPTTANAYDSTHNGDRDIFISRFDSTLQNLLASTYVGGSGDDDFSGGTPTMVIDSGGNIYVSCGTESSDFPTTTGSYDSDANGGEDGVISKLDSNLQNLLASTYLGGSGDDVAQPLAIDNSGNVYVAGVTGSSEFPTTSNAYDSTFSGPFEIFISRFDDNLENISISTFFGGSNIDEPRGLFIDSSGDIYITGNTLSPDLPITPGAYDESHNGDQDVFIAKLDGNLSAASTAAISFPDYFPTDPLVHGVKTFEWTVGRSGEFTSEIIGDQSVPYTTGGITGKQITNFSDLGTLVASNDGSVVKFLGNADVSFSADELLSEHPNGWAFSTLSDGGIHEMGAVYFIKNSDLSVEDFENDEIAILVDVQDVTVSQGQYNDAVIWWALDKDIGFSTLTFNTILADLGITPPTILETNGYAVTNFEIYGFNTGLIASGDVEANNGNLVEFSQLKELKVNRDQVLFAVGSNSRGQLGDGTNDERHIPVAIDSSVKAVAAGIFHSLFLKGDGTLMGMGDGEFIGGFSIEQNVLEPKTIDSGVSAISAGARHSLYVKNDGTLMAMGENEDGQLGDGTTMDRLTPIVIDSSVVAVSAGTQHSLYVKIDGTLMAMGKNASGQLGDGTRGDKLEPVVIDSNVSTIAAGNFHSLYVKNGGTLMAMGWNDSGQLGDGTTNDRITPVMIDSDVKAVAAGNNNSFYVKTDGTLMAMGANNGRLGDGTRTDRHTPIVVDSDVIAVASGPGPHTLYLKEDGTMKAMGWNDSGQLGDGTTMNRSTPVVIDSNVAVIATGNDHSLYVKSGSNPSKNNSPTIDPISNVTILDDRILQTINLTGISSGGDSGQTLTVTASSSNPEVIPNPSVNYTSPNETGTLMFTPVADAEGAVTITVTVRDDGGTDNGGVDTVTIMFEVTLATATILYEQPFQSEQSLGLFSNIGPLQHQVGADQFTLSEDATITGVRWHGYFIGVDLEASVRSLDFSIRFYMDNGGVPAKNSSYEQILSAQVNDTGFKVVESEQTIYEFTASSIPPYFVPQGDMVWISIAESDSSTPAVGNTQWLWNFSPFTSNDTKAFRTDSTDPDFVLPDWELSPQFGQMAFSLLGIPESLQPFEADLAVSPVFVETKSVDARSFEIKIFNEGQGQMGWSASTNDDWIVITSDSSGINNGKLTLQVKTNGGLSRTGKIVVTAPNAINSPQVITIRQSADIDSVVYQMPMGNPLNDVKVIDSLNVVAVGDNGEIITTHDGGTNWNHRSSGSSQHLNACDAIDDHVWAVGDGGTILHSNDYGSNWVEQISGTSENLTGLSFASSDLGWVVGAGGTILFTVNGGNDWTTKSEVTSANLNGVKFIDDQKGWIVGDRGLVLHSSDGGELWTQQESNSEKKLQDISFGSQDVGYIAEAGSQGTILKTIDGGENWVQLELFSFHNVAVDFVDESRGSIIRNDGHVFTTEDGGQNWNSNGVYRNNVNSLDYSSNGKGWCVGGKNGTFIANTTNFWKDFEYQELQTRVPINAIYFLNENKGWVGGGNFFNHVTDAPNIIMKTENGGLDWETIIDDPGFGIYDIQFIDASNGWAISRNKIYSTIDGGNAWESSPLGLGLASLHFVNKDIGYVAGSGRIYKTINGGFTWDRIEPDIGNTIYQSILFIDENIGWASGYGIPSSGMFNSRIIHTSDGGNSWELQYDQQEGGRTWLHFQDELNGWAVTNSIVGENDGLILQTSDGGETWMPQNSGVTKSLFRIFFTDKSNGWVVGEDGVVLKTIDGGEQWSQQNNPTNDNLFAVFARNDGNAWAAGDDGTVLILDTPILAVSPVDLEIPSTQGTTTIDISNSGTGIINWNIESDSSWLTIEDSSSGINSEPVSLRYESNPGEERTANLTVTAKGAAGSPKTIRIRQLEERKALLINSEYGNPQGSGEYSPGQEVNWSVTSPWPSEEGENGERFVADTPSGSVVMDSDKTITIEWRKQYFLNFQSDDEIGIALRDSSGTGWYDENTNAAWSVTSPMVIEEHGKQFVANPSNGTIMMDSPKTVIVDWRLQWYLDVETNGAGAIDIDSRWIDDGSEVALNAIGSENFTFSRWHGAIDENSQPTENPLMITMDEARQLIAIFDVNGDQETLTLELKKGWNLISLPHFANNPEINALLGGLMAGNVWQWKDNLVTESEVVKPRTGYWLYCERNTTIDIPGVLDTFAANELHPGWNLVGVVNSQSLPEGSRSSWTWNGNQFVVTDALERWKAYWIYMDEPGILAP